MVCTLLWLQCAEMVSTTIVLTMLHITEQQHEKVWMTEEKKKRPKSLHTTRSSPRRTLSHHWKTAGDKTHVHFIWKDNAQTLMEQTSFPSLSWNKTQRRNRTGCTDGLETMKRTIAFEQSGAEKKKQFSSWRWKELVFEDTLFGTAV